MTTAIASSRLELIRLIGDVITEVDVLRSDFRRETKTRKNLDNIRDELDTAQRILVRNVINENTKQFKEAGAHLEKALVMREQTVPEFHPCMADTLTNLGKVFLAGGEKKKARAHFQRALAIYKLRYGDNHSSTRATVAYVSAVE